MTFIPFDDTQTKARGPRPTTDGVDTSTWDQFRQGVDVNSDRYRFLGTQPKMWSGNLDGTTTITTYGQSQGVIENNPVKLEGKFRDLPEYNPVAYISQGSTYPLPVGLNDGLSPESEATIEPITIIAPKNNGYAPFYPHSVVGNLEDGNSFDSPITKASSRIEQFMERSFPATTRPFQDAGGGGYLGPVRKDPYLPGLERKIVPFDDTSTLQLDKQLINTSTTIKDIAAEGAQNIESILPYGKKSSTAGWSYYGSGVGQYGTDSIAFGGWSRGS